MIEQLDIECLIDTLKSAADDIENARSNYVEEIDGYYGRLDSIIAGIELEYLTSQGEEFLAEVQNLVEELSYFDVEQPHSIDIANLIRGIRYEDIVKPPRIKAKVSYTLKDGFKDYTWFKRAVENLFSHDPTITELKIESEEQ